MQWMRRYDSCATHDHFQRLRFRRACVQPRLIIAVSRRWQCRRTSRVRWERCRKPNQSLRRSHRRNIFNPNYNAAGAAYGPHLQYRFCQWLR